MKDCSGNPFCLLLAKRLQRKAWPQARPKIVDYMIDLLLVYRNFKNSIMQTKSGFTKMSVAEFENWIANLRIARTILKIQQHHTYIPSYVHFTGNNHFERQLAMKNWCGASAMSHGRNIVRLAFTWDCPRRAILQPSQGGHA